MTIKARVLADSVGDHGVRLISIEAYFPRFILPQITTYGTLSVSARSSRAVPTEKMIAEVKADPFIPREWCERVKGMRAGEPLPEQDQAFCAVRWGYAVEQALHAAGCLAVLGAAKEHVNRLLEPFAHVWAVLTGTRDRWQWVFEQRISAQAQPEFNDLAVACRDVIANSRPWPMAVGEWHLPYLTEVPTPGKEQHRTTGGFRLGDSDHHHKISAARVARVSYKPFDAESPDHEADLRLAGDLERRGEWEPFQHVAMCCKFAQPYGGRHTGFLSARTRMGY